jgi:hypothetical protein
MEKSSPYKGSNQWPPESWSKKRFSLMSYPAKHTWEVYSIPDISNLRSFTNLNDNNRTLQIIQSFRVATLYNF